MKREDNEGENGQNETLDFNKPDFVFAPKGHHSYRQAGPYLVCKSCEIQHATWIGMDLLMVGVEADGKPILKKKDMSVNG